MLTPEQRAAGLRLLADFNAFPPMPDCGSFKQLVARTDAENAFNRWLSEHGPALLAEPAAIDVEAIKRAAVREFAESLRLSFRCRAELCRNSGCLEECTFWELHAQRGLSEFCNRKGINLQ